ncbi:hypothetical protein GCM10009797_37940 [Nocardioides hwasunensis]
MLVVDDEPDVRDLVTLMLRRAGYEVHSVADPREAIAAAEDVRPDAAVLDWSMPGMNGGQLCSLVREHPELGDLPVLILTAHADRQTRDRAFASGADDFMSKPFTLAELTRAMAGLIDSRDRAGAARSAPLGLPGPDGAP